VPQLLYVLVNLQYDLVLPHGLSEGSDQRDIVCPHYDIKTPVQPCIRSLNASDEWRELIIVLDQHMYPFFV